jgi:hypothetical protein
MLVREETNHRNHFHLHNQQNYQDYHHQYLPLYSNQSG